VPRDRGFLVAVADRADSTTVVSVRGDVDVATSPTLRRLLAAVQVCRHRERLNAQVVIDLSRVTLLDASGLAVLVDAARSARGDGYMLVLRDPSLRTMRVLEITRLLPLFHVEARPSGCRDGHGDRERLGDDVLRRDVGSFWQPPIGA
jgi:anti-sigma B factor antagonist